MGSFSLWHWLVVLLVVVLLFGTKKLRNLGSDLGEAVRGFRKGLSGEDQAKLEADEKDPQDATQSAERSGERRD